MFIFTYLGNSVFYSGGYQWSILFAGRKWWITSESVSGLSHLSTFAEASSCYSRLPDFDSSACDDTISFLSLHFEWCWNSSDFNLNKEESKWKCSQQWSVPEVQMPMAVSVLCSLPNQLHKKHYVWVTTYLTVPSKDILFNFDLKLMLTSCHKYCPS